MYPGQPWRKQLEICQHFYYYLAKFLTPFKIDLQRCKIKSFSLLSNTNDHYFWASILIKKSHYFFIHYLKPNYHTDVSGSNMREAAGKCQFFFCSFTYYYCKKLTKNSGKLAFDSYNDETNVYAHCI